MDLNWEAIGAVGEIVGATAVVVSLAYLALQLRVNSRAIKFESELKIRTYNAEFQKILTEPDKSRIWRIGLGDPEALTADELISFYSMVTLATNNVALRLVYEESNRISGNAFEAEADTVSLIARYPGFLRWWRVNQSVFSSKMIGYVEQHIQTAKSNDV